MKQKEITYEDIKNLPLWELCNMALKVKLRERGTKFGLCTITNAKSGNCSENCTFCAQSAISRARIEKYPLKPLDVILKEAREAKTNGAQRFSLVTSGKGPSEKLLGKIAEYVHEIRERVGIKVCASLGIINKKDLKLLKEAGLTRYHHNLETSERYYPKVCTTHSFVERVKTIEAIKEVGLEACAGGIIGLGEDERDRFQMIEVLRGLQVESSPLNILVPIRGTPLENQKILSISEVLRTIAFMRLLLPGAAIRIAGGREVVLKDFQTLAFMSGADAMLIGGYLTTRGRPPSKDIKMVEELKEIWKGVQV